MKSKSPSASELIGRMCMLAVTDPEAYELLREQMRRFARERSRLPRLLGNSE